MILGVYPIGTIAIGATSGFAAGTAIAGSAGVVTVVGISAADAAVTGLAAGSSTSAFNSGADAAVTGTAGDAAVAVAVSSAPPPAATALPDVRLITVEITAAIDATGTQRTFYLSTQRFASQPTDSPANVAFDETLVDPGTLAVTAFGDGRTGGGTRLSYGEIKLTNADGQYDGWLNYGFDGRKLVIRRGTVGAYPGAYPAVLSGTVETLTVNRSEVVVRLRDKQLIFDRPVLTTTYAGTNALPNGLEGTANDIKGHVKPRLYGKGLNISPPCVNTSKLVYQISDGALASVDGVYDRGNALTAAGDFANSAALLAAAPTGGTYITCLAEGYIRLGGSPAGTVSVDATQGASAADRTAAQMLRSLAVAAGVSSGDVSAADVAALDVANSAVLGLWLSGQDTYAKAMDQVAGSVGAYYGFDPGGTLRMAQLTAPSGSPVLDLQEYDALGLERRPARDGDLPVWAVTVRHSRIWTVQSSDLSGSVTDDRRAYLASEYRSERAEDATVKNQYLLAGELVIDTLLTSATDAAAEAARLLALHKVHRDFFDVPVVIDRVTASGVKLMDVVSLTNSRFGLSAGRLLRGLGMNYELVRNRVTLTLWG